MKYPKFKTGHELIQFQDGMFGVRKWESQRYLYLGVTDNDGIVNWWSESYIHKYGKSSKENVFAVYNKLLDTGTPVSQYGDSVVSDDPFDNDWSDNEEQKPKKSFWGKFFG